MGTMTRLSPTNLTTDRFPDATVGRLDAVRCKPHRSQLGQSFARVSGSKVPVDSFSFPRAFAAVAPARHPKFAMKIRFLASAAHNKQTPSKLRHLFCILGNKHLENRVQISGDHPGHQKHSPAEHVATDCPVLRAVLSLMI